MALPSIAVVNLDSDTRIVEQIFTELFGNEPAEPLVCGEWGINTKYYKCSVSYSHHGRTSALDWNEIEALILTISGDLVNIDELSVLLKEVQLAQVPICLIALDSLDSLDSADDLLRLATQHEFEVVEMKTPCDCEARDYGVARITDALHAHHWSNAELISEPPRQGNVHECAAKEVAVSQLPEEEEAEESTDEDFEELFSNLMSMKNELQNLRPHERRKKAEDITVKFWQAIKGSDDEVDGLDDSL